MKEQKNEAKERVWTRRCLLSEINTYGLHHYDEFKKRAGADFKTFMERVLDLDAGKKHRLFEAFPNNPALIGVVIYEGYIIGGFGLEQEYCIEVSVVPFPSRKKDSEEIEEKICRILNDLNSLSALDKL